MSAFLFAAFMAYFVKGISGFANTLVLTSIMSFFTDNARITPVDLLLGYPANVIQAVKNRKGAHLSQWLPVAVCVVLGNIPGAVLLKRLPAAQIKLICGAAVMAAAAIRSLKRSQETKKGSSRRGLADTILWGMITGISCGLFGIGAFLAVYMGKITHDSREFKGNISLVFLTENTFRILLFLYLGLLTKESLIQTLYLIPAMIIGLWSGITLSDRLNEAKVQNVISATLFASGAVMVVQNLF